MHSKKMFHEVIFLRYGVPRIVISDGGSHFIDRTFQKALSEVGVDHWIATQKAVNQMGRSWRSKLSEVLRV
jgi:transposase InsO family protein